MGFNLSQIVNKQVPVQEQSSYDFVFIPPKYANYYTTNFTQIRSPKNMDGLVYLFSTTAGHKLEFRFTGRRIGISLCKAIGYGKISFDVDGTAYGVYDAGDTDGTYFNVPYVIATDLTDGEHVLTITKLDANSTSISGFLVDNTSYAQVFSRIAIDLHASYDDSIGVPIVVNTSDTTIVNRDFWVESVIFSNTTASPITITLKNNAGSIFGNFIIPANDSRVINAKMYCAGGLKAVATATGCSITVGGQ